MNGFRQRLVRDAVLFICGLSGIVHETVLTEEPRETLLLLFAAMVGLPAFIRADERKNSA
jgi:hypothetical protein